MDEKQLIELLQEYMREKRISSLKIDLFDDPIYDFSIQLNKIYSIEKKGAEKEK